MTDGRRIDRQAALDWFATHQSTDDRFDFGQFGHCAISILGFLLRIVDFTPQAYYTIRPPKAASNKYPISNTHYQMATSLGRL